MKKILLMSALSVTSSVLSAQIVYPESRKTDVSDTYHGTTIADPYRWLEDDRSSETEAWVKAQNALTQQYLSKIPARDKIRRRLEEVWNYEKYSTPILRGEYLFYFRNTGTQNQSVLYCRKGLDGTDKLILDPNTMSADGTTSLNGIYINKDASAMVYSVSVAGSDWNEFFVIDPKTGTQMKDHLKNIKFSSAAWYKNGFFYSAYDAPDSLTKFSRENSSAKVYYHTLGTNQSADRMIYSDPEHPKRRFEAEVSDDEQYLLLYPGETTSGNGILCRPLNAPDKPFKTLAEGFRYDYNLIGMQDGLLYFLTNDEAPMYRILSIHPETGVRKEIVPQAKSVLSAAYFVKNGMILQYLENVSSRLEMCSRNGTRVQTIDLPATGIFSGLGTDADKDAVFYSFTNFTTPNTVYYRDTYNTPARQFFPLKLTFNPDDYVTQQVFYPSKDGTMIPMFLTWKKGLKPNASTPCYLYGYGGFNISVTPAFNPANLIFTEAGGIYAVANIRGGGEFGTEWHKAGTLERKQNVFDDFIAAAEYLIQKGYTSSAKLAISGRSNGGLLVGACMTQRPDLFRVALPGVGVLDMLRYHKFTIGYAWATDYGRSDDPSMFPHLLKYSPLHTIRKTSYPSTMVYTADHDDRVVPAHSFKFTATLQAHQQSNNPILIRVDVNAGHGAGKPVSKTLDEWADIWSFVLHELKVQHY